MAIPTLDPLWRPNVAGPSPNTRDDRELIRQYSNQPAVEIVLHDLTVTMNCMATISPAAVAQIQTWINEIVTLETSWAAQVTAGTAHYAQAIEYEGPIPGATITRDDMVQKADVMGWDTDLLKVKYKAGAAGNATQAGSIGQRITDLRSRVLASLDLLPRSGQVVRS